MGWNGGGGSCDQHSVYRKSRLLYWSLRAQCEVLVLSPKRNKKKRFYYSTFLEWHTHTSHRGLQSHTVFHTLTWPGRDCDCLMVSLHLNTALDDSEWCTQITASLVIYLLVFLLCLSFFFSFKCTCMALGRSGALLISINILFKNKRSTVYNTFHNHTWFLHKNVAKQVSSLSWPSSPLSPNLPPPSLVPTASPRGSAARP